MIGGSRLQPLSKRAAVLLASLLFVLCTSQAAASSPSAESSAGGSIPEWIKTTAQADGFGRNEFPELEAYKRVSAKRKLQGGQGSRSSGVSDGLTTVLAEADRLRLTRAMETRIDVLQDGADVVESIFEFENHSYTCGPSDIGGSVFEPSSYACTATCKLTLGEPFTSIGEFHNEIVNDYLPTLHALRSLKTAMTGRNDIGEAVDHPIGGIAFVFNLLHTSENAVCALSRDEMLNALATLFNGLESLLNLLRNVPFAPPKLVSKLLLPAFKKMNENLQRTMEQLDILCVATTAVHVFLLEFINAIRGTITTMDKVTALMVPPMVEATCTSDNTFTLANELVASIEERSLAEDAAGSARARRGLLKNGESRRLLNTAPLPKTGDLTLHDRRHFAASMTPHPRDLPIRRALMYSDWEPRSSAAGTGGVGDGQGVIETDGANRRLDLKEPLPATEILSGALTSMNSFLQAFAELDEIFRTFGQVWVDVSLLVDEFFDALTALFDILDVPLPGLSFTFMEFFNILFRIGDIFQFLKCPKALGFVCNLAALLSSIMEAIFAPVIDIFEDLIDQFLSIFELPELDFTFPNLLPDPLPWVAVMEAIREAAVNLVQEIVAEFIDDPLPALYEVNTADLSGLDILYAGKRIDTEVAIEDCSNVFENDNVNVTRLPLVFHGIQSSAFCPLGTDFTAASLFPCGGFGEVPLITGDDCTVSSDGKVHYACARSDTVEDIGQLPEEAFVAQGAGPLSCGLGRYAVDLAEIGAPCMEKAFLDDPSDTASLARTERVGGCPIESDGTNCHACDDIDKNVLGKGNPEYISALPSYLELLNVQAAAHFACGGDHMCLVGVWVVKENIVQMLQDVAPPEILALPDEIETMAAKHLDLYLWGTSNPFTTRLQSTHSEGFVSEEFWREEFNINPEISGIFTDDVVEGITGRAFIGGKTSSFADHRTLTKIDCGLASYLERVVFFHRRAQGGSPVVTDDIADLSYSCYGDRSDPNGLTNVRSSARFNSAAKFDAETGLVGEYDMDCRGPGGGIKEVHFHRRDRETLYHDNDFWGVQWTCMNGTTGARGEPFTRTQDTMASCVGSSIRSFEQWWQRDTRQDKQAHDDILFRLTCSDSPLQLSRHLAPTSVLEGFSPGTNAGKYFSRRSERLAEYEPDVPVCERKAVESAAICNAMPLDRSQPECELPGECDSAVVRYFCPVPGIDSDLPDPERVANSFGDNNLKDALVECPTGLVYVPLDVTQGVPPLEFDPNPLADFVNSGCDSTTSSCVYTSPDGKSGRVVYQCVCREGFTPLPNESGECELCPLGTHRPFVAPDDGSPAVLADSCLSCPEGTYGDPEALVPTCTPCPKNTYSDKLGVVGVDACIPCLAGHFTEADGGVTSSDECTECGENFECPLFGERAACAVGTWTDGNTKATSCVSCPPGTFYPADIANTTCTLCPPGTFNDGYARTGCTPCPVGTFGRSSGADTCEVCPEGTFQDQVHDMTQPIK
eukprot:g12552.t1